MNFMASQQTPHPEPARQKEILRPQLRSLRQNLCPHHRIAESELVVERLELFLRHDCFQHVALYLATPYEVNLDALIGARLAQGKSTFLPYLEDETSPFRLFTAWEELEIGAFGFRQPSRTAPARDTLDLDVVVLPGLAFDAHGHRLGQGGGWYDRVLQERQGHNDSGQLLIGVCFEEQILPQVPQDQFDIVMDIVMTPSKIWRAGKDITAQYVID